MNGPGPYSPVDRILRIDRRTREGRLVSDLRSELHAHIPAPNVVQRMAIDRAVAVYLRLLLMDRRLATGKKRDGAGDPLFSRAYNENNAAFMRLLALLGVDPTVPGAEPAAPPLADYLAATADRWPRPKANGGAAP